MKYINTSEIKTASVMLSTIDLAHMDTIPVEIIPSPGVGKKIVPLSVFTECLPNGFVLSSTSMVATINFSPAGASWSYNVGALQSMNSTGATDVVSSGVFTLSNAQPSSDISNIGLVVFSSDPISPLNSAPIAAISPQTGTGSGYAVNDQGTINQGGNNSAFYIVDAVNGTGGVTAAHVYYSQGNNYTSATAVPTVVTSGSGNGAFLVDIVSTGTVSLIVTIQYLVI